MPHSAADQASLQLSEKSPHLTDEQDALVPKQDGGGIPLAVINPSPIEDIRKDSSPRVTASDELCLTEKAGVTGDFLQQDDERETKKRMWTYVELAANKQRAIHLHSPPGTNNIVLNSDEQSRDMKIQALDVYEELEDMFEHGELFDGFAAEDVVLERINRIDAEVCVIVPRSYDKKVVKGRRVLKRK